MGTLSLRSSLPNLSEVLVWVGRLISLTLLLFWGAFLVEHSLQWFLRTPSEYPPAWVWVAQVFHLAMVLGLAAMLKWGKVGSLVTIAGTAGFLLTVGDWDILGLGLVNLLPTLCFAAARITTFTSGASQRYR